MNGEDIPAGTAGTTDQKPRWVGSEENRPRGYAKANEDVHAGTDASVENVINRSDLSDSIPGDTQAHSGAGPALAAHSRDASSKGATGQNRHSAATADVPSNDRETGARKLSSHQVNDDPDELSQDAAKNRRPPDGQGNSAPVDDVMDETHQTDGRNP